MDKEIIIRKVRNTDLDGLVKLFNNVWPDVVYDKKAKAEFVILKSQGISYCAEIDGEIVGSRLSFYVNQYDGSKALKCIQVCDTCTREDYRGKGVLSRMNSSLLDDFFNKENGDIIWNVSAEGSKRVNEKLGWKYIKSFAGLTQVARPFHIISKIGLNIKSLFGQVDWDLKGSWGIIDSDLLKIREQIMRDKKLLHVCYDEPTLKWRLKYDSGIKVFSHPSTGAVIYKVGERRGLIYVLIGELFLYDYRLHNFKSLLKAFKSTIRPDVVKAAVSLGHPLLPFYKSCCFINNPKGRFYNHGVRTSNSSGDYNTVAYNPHRWAISMLDVDTF